MITNDVVYEPLARNDDYVKTGATFFDRLGF